MKFNELILLLEYNSLDSNYFKAIEDNDNLLLKELLDNTAISNQIKSADLITYDNDNKIIPLSKRFDSGNDIRGQIWNSIN